MNNFILNGYDRSGTSAISRILAKHPDIELIFRPFNSGPVRKKMYKLWDQSVPTKEDKDFFKNLDDGILEADYFISEWHRKYSTVKDSFKAGKLHVIITNINHFTVKWVATFYPNIEQWAIWRDPVMILNSCIKNEFYGNWYSDALSQVFESVKKDKDLNQLFGDFIQLVKPGSVVEKTAFLIAVRNYFLFKNIIPGKIINYDIFRNDANLALKPVLQYFELNSNFDFNRFLNVDFNSIPSVDGYEKNRTIDVILSEEEIQFSKKLFEPLYSIYEFKSQRKFSIK